MIRILLFLAIGITSAGCGNSEDGPRRARVRGAVTLDGQPLEEGTITFIPTDGSVGPATGASIVDGAYDIHADVGPLVGPNLVQIRAMRSTGELVKPLVAPESDGPAPELIEERVDIIPARYNSQSDLVREVQPDTVNEFNFALEPE